MPKLIKIRNAEQKIRDLVTCSPILDEFSHSQKAKNRIFCALDLIGDTTLAMHSFVEIDIRSSGLHYLTIYGLFQSIVLQINACKSLASHLKIPVSVEMKRESADIKNIRILIAGHPDDFKINGETGTSGISRRTMSKNGFTIGKWIDGKRVDFETVNLRNTLDRCVTIVNIFLEEAIKTMEHKQGEFADNWQQKPLHHYTDILPYLSEKIGQGAWGDQSISLSLTIESIRESIANLDSDPRINLDCCEYIRRVRDDVLESLPLIIELDAKSTTMSEQEYRQLKINCRYLQDRLNELCKSTKEVDSNFMDAGDFFDAKVNHIIISDCT